MKTYVVLLQEPDTGALEIQINAAIMASPDEVQNINYFFATGMYNAMIIFNQVV